MAKFIIDKTIFSFIYNKLNEKNKLCFDWDQGNETKSIEKHGVENFLAESCLSDRFFKILGKQEYPFVKEDRYGVVGKAKDGSILFVVFTFRNEKVRIISTRNANKKEISLYEY